MRSHSSCRSSKNSENQGGSGVGETLIYGAVGHGLKSSLGQPLTGKTLSFRPALNQVPSSNQCRVKAAKGEKMPRTAPALTRAWENFTITFYKQFV